MKKLLTAREIAALNSLHANSTNAARKATITEKLAANMVAHEIARVESVRMATEYFRSIGR